MKLYARKLIKEPRINLEKHTIQILGEKVYSETNTFNVFGFTLTSGLQPIKLTSRNKKLAIFKNFFIKIPPKNYSTIAKTSACFTIIYSSPSYLTSVPEYLLVITF